MLTIEQRRELLQNWYDKFGLDSLLDMCAYDLQTFAANSQAMAASRNRLQLENTTMAAELQELKKQLREATKHD